MLCIGWEKVCAKLLILDISVQLPYLDYLVKYCTDTQNSPKKYLVWHSYWIEISPPLEADWVIFEPVIRVRKYFLTYSLNYLLVTSINGLSLPFRFYWKKSLFFFKLPLNAWKCIILLVIYYRDGFVFPYYSHITLEWVLFCIFHFNCGSKDETQHFLWKVASSKHGGDYWITWFVILIW